MESFGNMDRENTLDFQGFRNVDSVENGKESLLKKMEEYCYLSEADFSEKEAKTLAILESHNDASKEFSGWNDANQRKTCELRKNLEEVIYRKDPVKQGEFLSEIKKTYCKEYVEARKKMPATNKSRKEKTMLDPNIYEEAEDSIVNLLRGIENELIIHEILEKIGLETRITSSKLDMINKIDIICSDGKLLIAVQVKGRFCKDLKNYDGKIFEELRSSDSLDPDKIKYVKGCKSFEHDLKIKNPEVELKKIWINIPYGYKMGGFGGYDKRMEKEIKEGMDIMLKI